MSGRRKYTDEERKQRKAEREAKRYKARKADQIRYAQLLEKNRQKQKSPKRREYIRSRRADPKLRARELHLERMRYADNVQDEEWKDKRNQRESRGKFLRRYGITVAERDALLLGQGSKCKICEMPIAFIGKSATTGAHIDHCHSTGRVRGILCASCNTTLGKFGDDPARLRKAAEYLETSDPLSTPTFK